MVILDLVFIDFRIVIVSSLVFMLASDLHKVDKFDLDAKMNDSKRFDTANQYAYSKHAQIFYTRIMARKFRQEGINAIICSTCPGNNFIAKISTVSLRKLCFFPFMMQNGVASRWNIH